MPAPLLIPPRPVRADGHPRRIGIELEFSGLSVPEAGRRVREVLGGEIRELDPLRLCVEGGELGDVGVELDLTAAHPSMSAEEGLAGKLKQTVHEAIGALGSLIMPVEIVFPPLALDRLPEVDRLVAAIRGAGAVGTRGGLLHAFGLHLNIEVAELAADYLLAHLRSFALLAAWLRAEVDMDLARRLGPFTRPYPAAYVRRLADPSYRPDRLGLIDDYLDANPTRDRELDLLPVLACLDGGRVRKRVRDRKIKPRPAFHYRLPNSEVDRPGWGVVEDWNRWVSVERLAADPQWLEDLGRRFLDVHGGRESAEWVAETARSIEI